MTQFTLQPRAIRACLLFLTADETRYVLAGVHATVTPTSLILAATDGRKLLVVNASGDADLSLVTEPTEFILPGKLLRQLPKADGRSGLFFEIDGSRVSIRGEWTALGELVDGKYPNWSAVIPRSEPTPLTYLRCMVDNFEPYFKVARILKGSDSGISVMATGPHTASADAPYLIKPLGAGCDWVGVLMPVRSEPTKTLPAWLPENKPPAAATQ